MFAQTDMKWRICEVDHKLPENENEPYIYKFDNSIVLENEKNKANRQLKSKTFINFNYSRNVCSETIQLSAIAIFYNKK